MFKVLYAYDGWSSVNYVLNDVKNPVRTLKISGPLGLGICAVLYFLANVAFFAYVVSFFLLSIFITLTLQSCNERRNYKLEHHCCSFVF
jgi:amino acid transporter